DQQNALVLAREAEMLRLEARAEAVNAQVSQFSAEKAKKAAEDLKAKADQSAKVANEQKAIAERNLQAAQAATQKANYATAAAQQSSQRLASALERGELIRSGLEAYRREQYDLAQIAFEKLEEKLRTLRAQANSDQNFTPQQLRQFERDYGWSQSRLGDTYHKLREFDKAIEHYESGRVILENVLKDEPAPILFETYHGLAHAYHDNAKSRTAADAAPTTLKLTAEQQLAKAEDYYKRAATYQESLKSNNPLIAVVSLKNLVTLYM